MFGYTKWERKNVNRLNLFYYLLGLGMIIGITAAIALMSPRGDYSGGNYSEIDGYGEVGG